MKRLVRLLTLTLSTLTLLTALAPMSALADDAAVTGPGQVSVGESLRVSGTGWKLADGSAGSVIAIKLDDGAISTKRTVLDPTTGEEILNKTVYGVVKADASGDWQVELPFPTTDNASATWEAGTTHNLRLLTGSLADGDAIRTMSLPVTVAAAPVSSACVPTSATATAKVTVVRSGFGGTLRLTGAGWCHPGAGAGGSTIAIKLDDGAYSRLDDSVNGNRTVWAIVKADDKTGAIDATLPIPTGLVSGANGTSPALPEGSHTLRLLTGSLSEGDAIRTLKTNAFTVGAYRPTSEPDPVEYSEDLTAVARGGASARSTGSTLVFTVPNAAKGDWVYLSAYCTDGSPTYPWGSRWFRAGSGGVVRASLEGVSLDGRYKLVAQSGGEGDFGTLLGWTWIGGDASTTSTTKKTSGSSSSSSTTGSTTTSLAAATTPSALLSSAAALTALARPAGAARAPVADGGALSAATAGHVTVTVSGTVATVTASAAVAGSWVGAFVYPAGGAEPVGAGWIQLDADKRLRLDLGRLAAGDYSASGFKIALVGADGKLLGWGAAEVASGATAATGSAGETVTPAAQIVRDGWQITVTELDLWLLGAGLAVLLGSSGAIASTRLHRKAAH